jgi:hypothetical protein
MLNAMKISGNLSWANGPKDIENALDTYIQNVRAGNEIAAKASLSVLTIVYAPRCEGAPIPAPADINAYRAVHERSRPALNPLEEYVISSILHYHMDHGVPMPRLTLRDKVVKEAGTEPSPFPRNDPHRRLMKVLLSLEEKGIISTTAEGLSLTG